ncbi:MAG: hypothetical protein A3I04_05680 [Nitrospinae bacterium RIFCSPLOWO2_02_FULL_39_110]|nr:MAG: hypothetical protein A3D97_03970 [Nitrospinae bacterium RIFCSPHIGHO2_12_FULL_39_42]OGV99864.1 MAG: hypothetical protein A3D20_05395 [Nitrospinae bacterium RIFCSPHIGHO2_02_FULL_39_82]OGW02896.1 MAG: hypothetical protein A2Z59_03410 [Nitrospinae bacterium RIFCSPLOWO2_02_39_17]OGW05871.1 MAG: hypothetical protein A3I04_05680 [Nitrospinae bacterium RIFCSPLOWO2_02_FULL_39_110]OGW11371.1 MAG: hypothetical protein A2W75_09365 [Nitrospinae bacterium RIFCSPLOWO2_12_39_15]OGW11415.1 MAG: hypothe
MADSEKFRYPLIDDRLAATQDLGRNGTSVWYPHDGVGMGKPASECGMAKPDYILGSGSIES